MVACHARSVARTAPALTASTLGAWLVKGSERALSMDELIRSEFASVRQWCLRASYRADLVAPGQPVLLWISGSSKVHPAGIYAVGRTTGPATADQADDGQVAPAERRRRTLSMPVSLSPLEPPVLRSHLLQHPALSRMEVLRMAAGSNPSFVTRAEWSALLSDWPQLTVR